MEKLTLGLCQGRHEIAGVKGYIFGQEVDPLDLQAMQETVHSKLQNCNGLDLYVTGLTVALVEVINYCCYNMIPLTLYHYNRDNGQYYPQVINTAIYKDLLKEGGYIA